MNDCEICARRPAVAEVDLRDSGPTFRACGPCSDDAADRGHFVTLLALEPSGQIPGQLTLDGTEPAA